MKQPSKLTNLKSAGEPKKNVTPNQHKAILRKKNEADRDTSPNIPISVCINVGADGKLSAIRFSPEAAAKISRAKGFPHYDLSPEEKRDKLCKLLDYDFSTVIHRGKVRQVTHFNPLASCYFRHMWDVQAGGKRTSGQLFADNNEFPRAMGKGGKMHTRSKKEQKEDQEAPNISAVYLPPSVLTKSSVRRALRTYSGTQGVSNFSPVAAGALYYKFLPKQGGIVFDPSCGWGGRLLGAIACGKVHKYIGCDPGTETFKGLEEMRDELLPIARSMGRNLEVEMYRLGSQTKEMREKLKPNSTDLVFSSPPYFVQEKYSDDPSQSWKMYPDQESWLNGFVGATLDNCAYSLKPGGVLAINIANVRSYKGSLEDDFLALATQKGFTHAEKLELELSAMPGAKHKYGKHKTEPIFVLRKR
jgi:hypothetical protein